MSLLDLPDELLHKIYETMRPRMRASTFKGLYACTRFVGLFQAAIQRLRNIHSDFIHLLTRMNTTRMVVETSPRLIWNDSRLTGHHCRILAEIMKFNVIPNLTSINLGHNVIGNVGAIATVRCAMAAGIGQLYSIRLNSCGIGGSGACAIALAAIAGYLTGIEELLLDNNLICDTGAEELIKACEGMPRLDTLYLNQNLLGEASAKAIALAGMRGHMQQMKELRLDDNAIGDGGAQALCDMLTTGRTLPNLQLLTLHHNDFDEHLRANLNATGRLNVPKYLHVDEVLHFNGVNEPYQHDNNPMPEDDDADDSHEQLIQELLDPAHKPNDNYYDDEYGYVS